MAYSGDSGPSDALSDAARDADLFVCEATLLRGELDGEPRGHLALDEALAAFEASGAKRLLVTHRPAELPSNGETSSSPTTGSSWTSSRSAASGGRTAARRTPQPSREPSLTSALPSCELRDLRVVRLEAVAGPHHVRRHARAAERQAVALADAGELLRALRG